MKTPRFATRAGTERFARRFAHLPADHFRARYGLQFSSIGAGTYLGAAGPRTSEGYVESIRCAVETGCNVIDTASNYRNMQAERDVGAALRALLQSGAAARDELILCTKGGYVAHDGVAPANAQADLQRRFYATGLAQPQEIVGGIHCLAPEFLSRQISTSLENLGVDAIDVYYLHNPETQLAYVTPGEFRASLRAAFERLESEVADGRIQAYGIATWDGFRVGETERAFLPLPVVVNQARVVAGSLHRFRFIQAPYNMRMLEPLNRRNQHLEHPDEDGTLRRTRLPLLAAAMQTGTVAIGAASLLQGRLLGKVPDPIKARLGNATFSDAQAALQFARSTPGLTTALVGMATPAHAREDMQTACTAPLAQPDFFRIFQPQG